MKMKIVTWNIGGAKVLEPGADPELMASYNVDALDDIVDKLKSISPDIIALQEIHKSETYDQAAIIASKLGYKYYINESFSWSHNEDGAELGNALISKYPMSEQGSDVFINPLVTVTWEDGRIAETHDKGFVKSVIDIDNKKISVMTLHLTPFRKFGMELSDSRAKRILSDVSVKIAEIKSPLAVVLGDFNIDDSTVSSYLPYYDETGFNEIKIETPTTPKGRSYDHILYKGILLDTYKIDSSVLTDHYVLISEFDI